MDTKNHDEAVRQNEKELRETLKSYHCWHTPHDCQGCTMVNVCNKETDKAIQQIRDAGFIHKSEAALDEGEIVNIINKTLDIGPIIGWKERAANAIAQAGIDKIGEGVGG